MNCRLVSWEEVYSLAVDLAKRIIKSGYKPETLIALARSGFVPGRIISDILGVTDLVSLKVEHWLDTTGKHKEEASIPYETPFDVKDKKILIIDDIVDTGKSMKLATEYLTRFKARELRTCVMQYITSSILKPDYYARTVNDWVWFVYPWNFVEDIGNLTERIMKTQSSPVTLSEVNETLRKTYGLNLQQQQLHDVLYFQTIRGRFVKVNEKYQIKS